MAITLEQMVQAGMHSSGKKILFVGTKKQASNLIEQTVVVKKD